MSTDPQWEALKLDVVRRESFRCESCRSPVGTAQVRHAYTVSGRPCWDYPDHALYATCDECHAKLEKLQQILALNTFPSSSRVETLTAISGLLNPRLNHANGYLTWVPEALAAAVMARQTVLFARDSDAKEDALSEYQNAVDQIITALHRDRRQLEVEFVRPCGANANPSAR